MRERTGGWLLILGGLAIFVALLIAPAVSASGRSEDALARSDFDALVKQIAERYQIHAKTAPMIWAVNLCARSVTHDGVKGMKVVQFEDAGKVTSADAGWAGFGELTKVQLGGRWSPMVHKHESGAERFVYAQEDQDGKHTRLIVVDLDGGELDLVSMTLNPEQLAKWTQNEDGGGGSKSGADGALFSE